MSDDFSQPGYDDLFHDTGAAGSPGQQPNLRRTATIAIGLVVGLGLIVTAIVVAGDNNAASTSNTLVCGGEEVTIEGTDGDDDITGTNERDVIHARKGNDVVTALAGNDLVCGGGGDDQLDGGRGRDIIIGGDGEDSCTGGDGASDTFEKCEATDE